MTFNRLAAIVLLATLPSIAGAQDFKVSFQWGATPKCNTGYATEVPSPRFELAHVPAGTKFIHFGMVDHDAPGYSHGGGTAAYAGQPVIEAGAFTYKGPCPPIGSHT